MDIFSQVRMYVYYKYECTLYLCIQHCSQKNQEWDCVLTHYYEQLAQTQSRGDNITVTTLQDLFYQVIIYLFIYMIGYALYEQIQSSLAPPTIMKEWAMKTFPTATDYWTFRRQVTTSILLNLLDFHSVYFVIYLYDIGYSAVSCHWSDRVCASSYKTGS